jgi:hypothetical protein
MEKKCILSTRLLREACHRKLWYLYQKIGNFILFKSLLEPRVFDIAIKIYKQKYEATSSVAMATSKQCMLYHGKYLCNRVQALSNLFTIPSIREKSDPFYF